MAQETTIGFDRTEHTTDLSDEVGETLADMLTHGGQAEPTVVQGDDGQATFEGDTPAKNPFDHGLDVAYGDDTAHVQHKRTDDHKQAGADLTDFKSPMAFARFLQSVGLDPYWDYARVRYESRGREYYNYVWVHDHLLVVTGNNPLTGDYREPDGRERETGYASYMGFEGTNDAITAVTHQMPEYTTHIKEGPVGGRRDFI